MIGAHAEGLPPFGLFLTPAKNTLDGISAILSLPERIAANFIRAKRAGRKTKISRHLPETVRPRLKSFKLKSAPNSVELSSAYAIFQENFKAVDIRSEVTRPRFGGGSPFLGFLDTDVDLD